MKKFFLTIIILCLVVGGLAYYYYTKAQANYVQTDQCQCLGLVKENEQGKKTCWGLVYQCPPEASLKNYFTRKLDSIRDRFKNSTQNNGQYTIENINLSSQPEYFQAGIYYKYVGENKKLNSVDVDVDLVLNALFGSNIPIEEVWYKPYSSSCCPSPVSAQDDKPVCMKAIVAPVFIIRTSQNVELEKYGFQELINPDIGWCAYSVTHYIMNAQPSAQILDTQDKFDLQSYSAKYGEYSCYQYSQLDSQLCRLMQVYASPDYSAQAKEDFYIHYYTDDTPLESLKSGVVVVAIELNDPEYELPKEYGPQDSKYSNTIFAHVFIDKLVQLSNQAQIKYVRQPLTPSSQ